MLRRISGCKPVFIGMTVLTFLTAIPLDPALAALVDTQAAGTEQSADVVRARVLALLAHSEIRATLLQHGVNPAEAEARVLAMTDRELLQLIESTGAMPAGAGFGATFWALPAVVIVALFLIGWLLVLSGVITLGAYAGHKISEYQEQEYAKSAPYPARPGRGLSSTSTRTSHGQAFGKSPKAGFPGFMPSSRQATSSRQPLKATTRPRPGFWAQ